MRVAKPSEQDIDEVMTFFKKKEKKQVLIPYGWRRVVWGAMLVVDDCCDHTEDHLTRCPYLVGHVSAEQ